MTQRDAPTAERLYELIERGRALQASDMHVEHEQGVAFRIFTAMERLPGVRIDGAEIAAFLEQTIDRLSRAKLDKLGVADAVHTSERLGAIRIHATRGKNAPRVAIRFLARSIPALETLHLPPVVDTFAELRSGLVLVAGPSGSGKSTTIASILDRINATTKKHVVTFEDPVEYTHLWLKSVVTQYEVGRDIATFAEGVRGALRADPDVLFIGELRGVETVTACLQAAETGHLVFAALHTPSESAQAVNRIIGLFPADEQDNARMRLADSLRALVGLRLLPLRDGTGLRAAAEIAVTNDALRRMIRDGSTHQLRSLIASSRREGSQTLETHLGELVSDGLIELSAARSVSLFPDEIRELQSNAYRRH